MGVKVSGTQFERRSILATQKEAAQKRSQENRYEAANPNGPDRSWLPAFVRDARYDANSFSRWEMSRKIRYIRRNCWLLQRMEDEHKKWTVGPNGLQVIPATTSETFNSAMLESYLEWCESPCLDSTLTMHQIHRLMSGEDSIDGEVFINFTRNKAPVSWFKLPLSVPAIQLIESHRCSSPGTEFANSENKDGVIDGVQLAKDSAGQWAKPSGYWVRDGFEGDEWVFRSTADMHHVMDPHRIGMYRNITPYHTTVNTLQDLEDMELMEMQRSKQNSEVANILTNPAGEMGGSGLIRDKFRGSGTTVTPTDDQDKRIEMYRRVLGARTIALRNGETLQQYDSKTPSATTQWYWRYKIGQVCSAAGIPLILIFPELTEGMQGTVVRGVYDDAHEGFRSKFFIYAHAARKMYRYYAQWARYNDPRCYDAPADWDKCHVIAPRAVNVDIGYTVQNTLLELSAGITSRDDVAGRMGTTAKVQLRKCANDVADLKLICQEVSKARGVEVLPEEVSTPLAQVALQLAQADAAGGQGGADDSSDDITPPKKTKEPVTK